MGKKSKSENIEKLKVWADENPDKWKTMSYKEISVDADVPHNTVVHSLIQIIGDRENKMPSQIRFVREQAGFKFGLRGIPQHKIDLIYELDDMDLPPIDIAVKVGVSLNTVRRYLKKRSEHNR